VLSFIAVLSASEQRLRIAFEIVRIGASAALASIREAVSALPAGSRHVQEGEGLMKRSSLRLLFALGVCSAVA
jgi:hypothetical protein